MLGGPPDAALERSAPRSRCDERVRASRRPSRCATGRTRRRRPAALARRAARTRRRAGDRRADGGDARLPRQGPVHGQRIQLVHGGAGSWSSRRRRHVDGDGPRGPREVWRDVDATATPSARSSAATARGGRRDDRRPAREDGHALVQRESDLRFVRRLARRNGFLFWITRRREQGIETAHFRRPPVGERAGRRARASTSTKPAVERAAISTGTSSGRRRVAAGSSTSDQDGLDGGGPSRRCRRSARTRLRRDRDRHAPGVAAARRSTTPATCRPAAAALIGRRGSSCGPAASTTVDAGGTRSCAPTPSSSCAARARGTAASTRAPRVRHAIDDGGTRWRSSSSATAGGRDDRRDRTGVEELLDCVDSHYFGKYRGMVVDNADPTDRGRLKVRGAGRARRRRRSGRCRACPTPATASASTRCPSRRPASGSSSRAATRRSRSGPAASGPTASCPTRRDAAIKMLQDRASDAADRRRRRTRSLVETRRQRRSTLGDDVVDRGGRRQHTRVGAGGVGSERVGQRREGRGRRARASRSTDGALEVSVMAGTRAHHRLDAEVPARRHGADRHRRTRRSTADGARRSTAADTFTIAGCPFQLPRRRRCRARACACSGSCPTCRSRSAAAPTLSAGQRRPVPGRHGVPQGPVTVAQHAGATVSRRDERALRPHPLSPRDRRRASAGSPRRRDYAATSTS